MKYKEFEKEWSELWFSFILENPRNWYNISCNPNITWDIIQNNPDKPWVWDGISSNPNITWDIIQNNPDKPWNWYAISNKPNITWDIIRNNPDKPWNWNNLTYNKFSKEKEDFIQNKLRNKFRKKFMGKGLNYGEYSLFRELMERVWSPKNLEKNMNDI